jgi:predicted ester cyclase
MSIEKNKAVVRQYIEAYKGDVDLLDGVWAPEGSVPTMRTLEQQKELVRWCHQIAPGFKITLLDMVAEGDKVAFLTLLNFTFQSPLDTAHGSHPPYLGKSVSWQVMHIVRLVDGKIVSMSDVANMTDTLVQQGVYTLNKAKTTET